MSRSPEEVLLAIDTATAAVAVAVVRDSAVLAQTAVHDALRHAEVLAPAIEAVVQQSGLAFSALSGIVVGTGPGPFTGLRVGVVTATTLGYALGVPVHGVCSLDALAESYAAAGRAASSTPAEAASRDDAPVDDAPEFVVATDARRKEVYWASYRLDADGLPVRLEGPAVDKPAHLPDRLRRLPVVGRGGQLYAEVFGPPVGPAEVAAASLAALARRRLAAGESLPVTPLYLRRPDVREPSAPKTTLLPAARRARGRGTSARAALAGDPPTESRGIR